MPKPHFRAGVVAVVRRASGEIMAFERSDLSGEWQLPQGGIESGETPVEAAWRELEEETGLTSADVRLVGEHDAWTVYEWPVAMQNANRRGQAHRWFFFEPRRDQIAPTPDGSEFRDWRWTTVADLIDSVVEFRTGPYRQVLGG